MHLADWFTHIYKNLLILSFKTENIFQTPFHICLWIWLRLFQTQAQSCFGNELSRSSTWAIHYWCAFQQAHGAGANNFNSDFLDYGQGGINLEPAGF